MRLPPCCHQVGEASVQPVSVNLWAGRAVVAEAHFDAHHTLTLTLTLALTLTLPLTLTPRRTCTLGPSRLSPPSTTATHR